MLPIAARIAWQQATGSDQAVENTRRLRHVLEATLVHDCPGMSHTYVLQQKKYNTLALFCYFAHKDHYFSHVKLKLHDIKTLAAGVLC